jgi:hypothetical protein
VGHILSTVLVCARQFIWSPNLSTGSIGRRQSRRTARASKDSEEEAIVEVVALLTRAAR